MTVSLDQFSELVASIYDAALSDRGWESAMRRMVTLFGGSVGGMLVAMPHARTVRHGSLGQDHAAVTAYNDYYGRLDPLARGLEHAPVGTVLDGLQIVPAEEHRRSEFYNDWAEPMVDAGDSVVANLMRGDEGIAWTCISAPLRSEPFATPERLRLMHLLLPHLQQAVQAQSLLAELGNRRPGAWEVLDKLAHGAVLFSDNGRARFINRAATRLAELRDGLTIGQAGIRADLRDEDTTLQRLIAKASGNGRKGVRTGGTAAITRPSGRRSFVVHVLPMGTEADPRSAEGLAVIVDPEREARALPSLLRRLYGLTRAEAGVAGEVLKGDGLGSVADRMAVSISTVRIHLQRVFDKTGTHRQAELARLLLAIEAGLEHPDAAGDG